MQKYDNEDIFHVNRIKNKIVFSTEQVEKIIELYVQDRIPVKTIAKMFSIGDYRYISRILIEHNLYEGCHQGYSVDETYFDIIDTNDKAYWLGYFYADGAVIDKTHEISLTSIDKEHLEKFQKSINAIQHKITRVIDDRYQAQSVYWKFGIRRKKLSDALKRLGCIPNKSLLIDKIPDIEVKYFTHFIREYFDGDGSIHCVNNQYRISFCGNYNFLKEIQDCLEVNTKINQNSKGKDYVFQVNGKYQLKRVLDLIYSGSSNQNRLNRKYEKYCSFLKTFGCFSLEPENSGCTSSEGVNTGNGI